ncbi:MAG: hypothetical protein ACP5QT_05810 [Brevinematia bacterium]
MKKLSLKLSIFLIISLLFELACTCVKKEGVSQSSSTGSKDVSNITSLITIQKGTKLILDSPKKFVELWILYNLEQKKWFEEISKSTNLSTNNEERENEIANILEEKKKEFYQSFGITEKDFVNYSMNNMKKIQAFLDENPEYKKAYEKSIE